MRVNWLADLIKRNTSNKKKLTESVAGDNFLTIMSREIRTPLNAIIGLGQLEMKNKSLPLSSKNTVEKILTSGQNLLKIINDVLDLSKIQNGDVELNQREYDIPLLVDDVCAVSRARIASRPIGFRVSVSPNIPSRLAGDDQRIKQILNNFLSDAIKNTELGFVSFSIDYIAGESPRLKFEISDSSQGMRPQDIPELFKAEKTGLELFVAKKVADFMGASIDVSSVYGKGSSFSIYIPQKVIDSRPIGEHAAENLERISGKKAIVSGDFTVTKLTTAKVLIVDDIQMNLEVMQGLLELYELDIDTAKSGQQAIDMLKNGNKYDIIFMDHLMPAMDGIEAVKTIRSMDGGYFKGVVIVAFSANALNGIDKIFLENEFDDFIPKPVDIRSLDICLSKWLKKKEQKKPEQNNSGISQILRQYVDFSEGAEQFGSEDIFKKVLGSFKRNTPNLLARLREQSGNDYAISIHALKGCARTIFAKEIGDRAYELETAARDDNWELVKKKNEDLIKDVQKLIDAISID